MTSECLARYVFEEFKAIIVINQEKRYAFLVGRPVSLRLIKKIQKRSEGNDVNSNCRSTQNGPRDGRGQPKLLGIREMRPCQIVRGLSTFIVMFAKAAMVGRCRANFCLVCLLFGPRNCW